MTEAASRRAEGIAWILLASVSFATMGAFTKAAVADLDVADVVFWRSVVVTAVAWALARKQGVSLRPGNLKLLVWRSSVGLVAMAMFFWSIGQVELGLANTLLYTSPLFIALLSGRVLGEAASRRAGVAAAVAFVGVVLLVQPAVVELQWGTFAALGSGLLAALAYLTVRQLRTTDPPARIVWFFSIFSVVATAPFALYDGVPMHWADLGLLVAVGLCAAGGQLAMTRAYAVEEATVVGPFSNATVVFSFIYGLIFWGETLSWGAMVGMALVIGACVVLSRGRGRGRPPAANIDK